MDPCRLLPLVFSFLISLLWQTPLWADEETEITEAFVSVFRGKFKEPQYGEWFQINANGTISFQRMRQVGRSDSAEVPYPTVCSFQEYGQITEVVRRSTESRQAYMSYATHRLTYNIFWMELNNELFSGSTSDPYCQNYLRQIRSLIHEGYPRSLHMELLDENQVRFHTGGGAGYVEGAARTSGTLDEVFSRTVSEAANFN